MTAETERQYRLTNWPHLGRTPDWEVVKSSETFYNGPEERKHLHDAVDTLEVHEIQIRSFDARHKEWKQVTRIKGQLQRYLERTRNEFSEYELLTEQ